MSRGKMTISITFSILIILFLSVESLISLLICLPQRDSHPVFHLLTKRNIWRSIVYIPNAKTCTQTGKMFLQWFLEIWHDLVVLFWKLRRVKTPTRGYWMHIALQTFGVNSIQVHALGGNMQTQTWSLFIQYYQGFVLVSSGWTVQVPVFKFLQLYQEKLKRSLSNRWQYAEQLAVPLKGPKTEQDLVLKCP